MSKVLLLISFVVFILLACDRQQAKLKHKYVPKPQLKIDTIIPDQSNKENHFKYENWQNYTDSINSYFFNRVGWKIDSAWSIDTSKTDKFILYDYRGKRMRIEVYEFDSKIEATDFFNDLKTIEYIRPFGLNKRPNHILVDSNRVYWHHMEHSFGHRMKDLNDIFTEAFEFHPNSSNLDSASGFNYCKCKNEDKELKRLKGKWLVEQPIQINVEPYVYWSEVNESSKCHFNAQDGMEISITSDSIIIDDLVHNHKVSSSFRLPDNSLFWKHSFPTDTLVKKFKNPNLSEEFISQTNSLRQRTNSIMYYKIHLKGWCDMTIIDVNGVGTYCISRGMFHKMKRMKD